MKYDSKRNHSFGEWVKYYYERYILFADEQEKTLAFAGGYPEGVDVSRWNVFFDPDLSEHQIDFAIQKLTEGTSYIDLALEEIWSGVAKVPVRGGYHYQRSGYSWQAQADHFLNVAARHDYHIYALDMESVNNTYNDTFFADGRRIIDYWRSHSNKRVLLYTNGSTYKLFAAAIKRLYADGQAWLDSLDFWYAWPSLTASEPILPTGCNAWKLWQYRWDGKNYGVNNNIDVNKFNGTLNQLHAWSGVTTVPEPPPDGGNMTTGLADERLGKSPSVRNGPSVTADKLYSLPPYSKDIEFIDFAKDLNGVDWWLDLGDGKYVNLEVAGVRYLIVTRMPTVDPEPPPPVGEPAVMEIMLADGSSVIVRDLAGSELFRWP